MACGPIAVSIATVRGGPQQCADLLDELDARGECLGGGREAGHRPPVEEVGPEYGRKGP
jgi:hypothetical protein